MNRTLWYEKKSNSLIKNRSEFSCTRTNEQAVLRYEKISAFRLKLVSWRHDLVLIMALMVIIQFSFAKPSGFLFNVNGIGSELTVSSVTPNHVYPNAGIKINTPGYNLVNTGTECFPAANGYCIFSVSDSAAHTLTFSGPIGDFSMTLCLKANWKKPISCQNYSYSYKLFYAYVLNQTDNKLFVYSINATTGALKLIPENTIDTGSAPNGIAITPNGKYLYVTNVGANTVSGYVINRSTGELTLIGNFLTGTSPAEIAISANGKFLYVTNYGSTTVSGYSINATNGELISIGTFVSGNAPEGIALSKKDNYAYVLNQNDNTVSGFSINPSSGELSELDGSPFNTGDLPVGIALSANDNFAYITNQFDDNVYEYSISASTGVLSYIGTVPTDDGPSRIVVSKDGKYAYVLDNSINLVSGYSINETNGALSSIGTSQTGFLPLGIALSANGSFAYVTNYVANTITGYTINSNGNLLQMTDGTFVAGHQPIAIALSPDF